MNIFKALFSAIGKHDKDKYQQTIETNKKRELVSFEQQLQTFKVLGFELNPDVEVAHVNMWSDGPKAFEEDPFNLLYITLGCVTDDDRGIPLTNRCWNFDTEAIEETGSYVEILENLQRISRGELKFTDIKDYVDIENNIAWVSFTLNGDNYRWNLTVDNDWVDTELFTKVVNLTRKYNTLGRFIYYDTGGQESVIGYETPESLLKLTNSTGLKIEWLT